MSGVKHTPGPVVPIDGQSFSSEQDWINRASRVLTAHQSYNNTEHGEAQGWRGPHFTALCFDQAGNRMRCGGDFKRATKEGTYPVWWVWPDQIVDAITAQSDILHALTEASTTIAMLRRNVVTEIEKHDGLFRWEGVPEALQARIVQCDAALARARGEQDGGGE